VLGGRKGYGGGGLNGNEGPGGGGEEEVEEEKAGWEEKKKKHSKNFVKQLWVFLEGFRTLTSKNLWTGCHILMPSGKMESFLTCEVWK